MEGRVEKKRKIGPSTTPSTEGREQETKKLFVFFWHGNCCKYIHSLFALDIPNPEYINPTDETPTITRTITTTTTTTTTTTVSTGQLEPNRIPVNPLLRFRYAEWPRIMSCARFSSSLYFFGGCKGSIDSAKLTYPGEVHILDVRNPRMYEQDPMIIEHPNHVMRPGPTMATGKYNPISFMADNKIFVLSGHKVCPHRGISLTQFEYLSPTDEDPRWVTGPDPPFQDFNFLGPYVVLDRKVIVACGKSGPSELYCYNLDNRDWSEFDTSGWTKLDPDSQFPFEEGSQYIGNTLYTSYDEGGTTPPVIIPIKYHGRDAEEEELLLKAEKYFDVIKYGIPCRRCRYSTLAPAGHRRLCFLQVGNPPSARGGDPEWGDVTVIHMIVSMFEVCGEGVTAKYLNSAHYCFNNPDRYAFRIRAAFLTEVQ